MLQTGTWDKEGEGRGRVISGYCLCVVYVSFLCEAVRQPLSQVGIHLVHRWEVTDVEVGGATEGWEETDRA